MQLHDCPADLTHTSFVADDANEMLDLLDSAICSGAQQAVCCQLASCTSSRAFELLCASCERRGLVFVGCPDAKEGAVFYDRDPTWQHELVSGPLVHQVALQWSRLIGKHLGNKDRNEASFGLNY